MKKTLICILAAAFCFSGCTAKIGTIKNDPESAKPILGTWNIITESEISIYSDPNDQDTYEAEIVLRKNLSLELLSSEQNQPGPYVMSTISKIKDYEPLIEETVIPLEDLKQNLNSSIIITGTYSANEKYLQLNAESITFADKVYSFEDFSKDIGYIGEKVTTVQWNQSENSLTLTDCSNKNSKITYTKKL